MNIIICVKQVPDTTEIRLDPVTGVMKREGVPSIINPDDRAGIEAAVRLKEKVGGTVTVLSMGPMQAQEALREAMAMGADRGVLLSDRLFGGADTWATAATLAAAIRKLDYDLIITGRQAIDGDTAQVGPQLAEQLGIPQVSYVEEVVEVTDKQIVVRRQFEDRYHVLEAPFPCLMTVLAELNTPRLTSPGAIIDAYREKEIQIWGHADLADTLGGVVTGLKGSPTQVVRSAPKPMKGAGQIHEVSSDQAVAIIIQALADRHII